MEILGNILLLIALMLVWINHYLQKKYVNQLKKRIEIEQDFGEIAMRLNKELLQLIGETIESYENSKYYNTEDVLKDILLTTNTKKEETAVREAIRLVKEKQEVKG